MDKPVSIYVDQPSWSSPINPDDFIVTIGIKQSNSVYHVSEVKIKKRPSRITRYYVKAFRSDLQTMLKRDSAQKIITVTWNKR